MEIGSAISGDLSKGSSKPLLSPSSNVCKSWSSIAFEFVGE